MEPTQVMEWSTLFQNIAFPIIVLIFLGAILWKLVPVLIDYVKAVIQDKKDLSEDRKKRADESGELRELIRNNSAVVNNNTAALTVAETNQNLLTNVLGKHMDESRDAHCRIENALKDIDSKSDKLVTDVKILKETK